MSARRWRDSSAGCCRARGTASSEAEYLIPVSTTSIAARRRSLRARLWLIDHEGHRYLDAYTGVTEDAATERRDHRAGH